MTPFVWHVNEAISDAINPQSSWKVQALVLIAIRWFPGQMPENPTVGLGRTQLGGGGGQNSRPRFRACSGPHHPPIRET